MRRWSVLLILALAALGLMVVAELTAEQPPVGEGAVVRLSTRTPTLTRTVGWWAEVATWTPTATQQANERAPTIAVTETPTPNLDIPPVRTLARPTQGGAP
jgi:hypothetical protein